jgi:AcrR family transcriptional regulator
MPDRSKPINTRDAILDATDRLLARSGYKKMTIDELAHEVGIGKGSIYLHFASKEEIALSHIDRIVDRLKARLRHIADDQAPAAERLHKMLLERVLFRFDSVQHYTQSLDELLSRLRVQLLARRQRYFSEESRIFAEVIANGVESGELAPTDPLAAATVLLEATNSLLPYSLSSAELGSRSEISSRVDGIAAVLIKGLMR